jgi:protein TonB
MRLRSTGFVIVSIMVHGLAVAAIAITPVKTVSDAGEKIEVQMGEPADKPGVKEAPPSVEESKPQVAKAQKPAKAKSAAPQPIIEAADSGAVAKVDSDESAEEPAKEEPKEILMPVKDSAPDGVEADTGAQDVEQAPAETEAESADVQQAADPSPVAVATATPENTQTGELTQGGASKEGAVSYLDLKQLPGNKSPNYPLKARLEKRQGNLELLYHVTKAGKVTDIQVAKSSGFKDLDDEAVRAIAQFKFVPGQEGWAKHPVSFSLKGAVSTMPSKLRGKGAAND